jgi:hypothetical protein
MDSPPLKIRQLILVPALLSLAVTVLRLVGELMNWSPILFNPEHRGGGALVGITWLVPIFGIYFALKLAKGGYGPTSACKVIGLAVLGIAVGYGIMVGAGLLFGQSLYVRRLASIAQMIAALAIVRTSWPELFRTLLAYAFAARIPVAVFSFFAILGNWGTHYDVSPPDLPQMGWFAKWFWTGLTTQLIWWIGFTVIMGLLFGGIAALLAKSSSGRCYIGVLGGRRPPQSRTFSGQQ